MEVVVVHALDASAGIILAVPGRALGDLDGIADPVVVMVVDLVLAPEFVREGFNLGAGAHDVRRLLLHL